MLFNKDCGVYNTKLWTRLSYLVYLPRSYCPASVWLQFQLMRLLFRVGINTKYFLRHTCMKEVHVYLDTVQKDERWVPTTNATRAITIAVYFVGIYWPEKGW